MDIERLELDQLKSKLTGTQLAAARSVVAREFSQFSDGEKRAFLRAVKICSQLAAQLRDDRLEMLKALASLVVSASEAIPGRDQE